MCFYDHQFEYTHHLCFPELIMNNTKNAISLLKEYHDRWRRNSTVFGDPTYTFQPQGPVMFGCTCKYKDFVTNGTGISKNSARIEAATLMLRKLGCPEPPTTPVKQIRDQRSAEPSAIQGNLKTSGNSSYTCSPAKERLAKDFFDRYSKKEGTVFIRYPPVTRRFAVMLQRY